MPFALTVYTIPLHLVGNVEAVKLWTAAKLGVDVDTLHFLQDSPYSVEIYPATGAGLSAPRLARIDTWGDSLTIDPS